MHKLKNRNDRAEYDRAVKEALQAVLANPALAKEAFPNPAIRENILPLIEDLEKMVANKKTS